MNEIAVLEDIARRLNQLLKERGWTSHKLSKESGVSKTSINNARDAASGIEVLTLARLCNALDVTFGEFFKDVMHKAMHLSKDEIELITAYRRVGKSDKKQAKAYVEGLAAAKEKKK